MKTTFKHRLLYCLKGIILFLAVIILSQCIKEEATLENLQISLNPGIGLPAVHAKYSLSSIFDTIETPDLIQPNNEGILAVQYSEKVFSDSAKNFIQFNQEIEGSTPINFKNEMQKISFKDTLEFKYSNSQNIGFEGLVYEIGFNYAQFNLSDDSNPLPIKTTIEIKFPSIVKPGTTDTARLEHIVGENNTSVLEMSEYVAKFINNETITNGLPIEFSFSIGIKSEKSFNLFYSFTLIDYDYIKGYFGQFDYNLGVTSMDIDFLSEVDEIEIEFETAIFSINYSNSFGINADIYLDNLSILSVDNELITTNFFPTPEDPFELLAPELGDSPVDTLKEFDINEVLDLLGENPKNIAFEPEASFNPDGPSETNFVTYDSQFALDIALNIPLKFKASVIAFKDTFGFNGEVLNEITQLEYLGLRFTSSNALPLDAVVNVHFLDENGDILYELSDETGESFKITSLPESTTNPEPFTQTIAIDNSKFEAIKQNKKLALGIALTTANYDIGDFVTFYEDAEYYIDIKLKLIAEGEYTDTIQ
ncbi:hypothetical protein ACFLQ9_00995 [Bacteroidota bacterium]